MRDAIDTNVLAYAEGVGDRERQGRAIDLLARLDPSSTLLPAQTLAELFRVLTRKARRSPQEARDAILGWSDSFLVVDSTWSAFQTAFKVSAGHGLQIWDALILSVAAENRCRHLLSEDLQDGFTWNEVTVVNPFLSEPSALLVRAIVSR